MVRLLGAFRRERNGLVADTMHYDGTRYGLNYGVSLVTVRQKVRALEPVRDEEFARFLMTQQVRCLQLAALHLADPAAWQTMDDARRWLDALNNSELAEELAFALLSKIYDINSLMGIWTTESNELISYAALMAAARNARTTSEVSFIAAEKAVRANPTSRNIANGVVALVCHIAETDKSVKVGIPTLLESMPDCPTRTLITEELEWRLEC